MRKIPVAVHLVFLLGVSATPVAAKFPSMPKELQGIWMDDNGEGRAQCSAYKAEKGTEAARNYLVGSEVISRKMLHSYSEYGEGNFYRPDQIKSVGKKSWTVKATLGLDQPPGDENQADAEMKLSLKNGKLTSRFVAIGGKASDETASVYFRCADVPAGMYGG